VRKINVKIDTKKKIIQISIGVGGMSTVSTLSRGILKTGKDEELKK
jgi:hypothetical protein